MTCDTCVELTLQTQDLLQENIRLKTRNTMLVRINSVLRKRTTELQNEADEIFMALCSSDDTTSET